jgi:4-amino-4-deoxy-L-arabinose transferase-like glycosyltransferase
MIKKYLASKDLPFWLLTISIMILIIAPTLIQDGMFGDAMLYTSVSHNLGTGIGSFWEPVFSPSYHNAGSAFFHEQPPLVFGIQSLFFKLLGDSLYVERFYTFLTMCVTAILLKVLWNSVFTKEQEFKKISWLPVILWITVPACIWSYSNNMMENTMGIFTISAVIFIFKSLESDRKEIWFLLLAGLFVFLATMSKGVPGLFPLAVPLLYWIVFRRRSLLTTIFHTLIIISVPLVLYFILFNIPESSESLNFYVTKRLLGRINNDPTVVDRLFIIKRLFTELLPQLIILLLIISISRLKKSGIAFFRFSKPSAFFFLTGLAASIPLTFTLVQRGFYLVPSFPYFALGFSILIAPAVLSFRETLISSEPGKFRLLQVAGILVFIFAIVFTFMQKGKAQRDRDMLHDVHVIGNAIPSRSEISVTPDIATAYYLECYFIRYYYISLFIDVPKDYQLVRKSTKPDSLNIFEKLNLDTKVYDIYQRKKIR